MESVFADFLSLPSRFDQGGFIEDQLLYSKILDFTLICVWQLAGFVVMKELFVSASTLCNKA